MSSIRTVTPESEPPLAEFVGLGRYQVIRELGRGTTGVVHQAHDGVLGHTVALKTVTVPLAMTPAVRNEFVRRFMVEARMVARLSHPNIVQVHDFGQDPASGTLYIALEYLAGAPLSEVISPPSVLLWPEALRIVERVADALHHAHSFGIVHRDVKPANLMLLPKGEPKLLDFGIAKIAEAPGHWSLAGQVIGTPLYMSPEQALGEPVDARSDVFALGAVLYFLLTGRPPFAAATIPHILLRILRDDPPPPSLLGIELPEDVEYVLARATAKAPPHRYQSAAAMSQDISDVLAGRRPRHRGAWVPPRANDTLPSVVMEGDAALAELEARLGRPAEVPAAAAWSLGSSIGLSAKSDGAHDRGSRRAGLRVAALVLATTAAFALTGRRIDEPLEPRSTGSASASRLPTTVLAFLRPEPFPMTPVFPTTRPEARPVAPSAPTPAVRVVPPATTAVVPPRPAHLALELEHSLRGGQLRLWIGDALRLDRALDGRSGKKVTVGEVMEVEPGAHRVKLQVAWDQNVREGAVTATFLPSENRRLTARLGGLLKKKIAMQWRDVPSPSPRPESP
jgi:eukaryotic-like serine/threonine-protein kinase